MPGPSDYGQCVGCREVNTSIVELSVLLVFNASEHCHPKVAARATPRWRARKPIEDAAEKRRDCRADFLEGRNAQAES